LTESYSGKLPSYYITQNGLIRVFILQMLGMPVQITSEQFPRGTPQLLMQFGAGPYWDLMPDHMVRFWIMPNDLRARRFEAAWGEYEG
jgi:hypothetical protein